MSGITTIDEFETAFNEGLGKPLPLKPWRTVSEESMWRYGEGIGDHNPLHRDPAYAQSTRFGDLVATPTFIYSIDVSVLAAMVGHIPYSDVSTRNLTFLYAGADIEWHRPLWRGDRIRTVERPLKSRRIQTPQVPNGLMCTSETEYWNSRGELVATLQTHMLRFENTGAAVAAGADRDPDIKGIAPDPLVWARERRGGTPRLWEDVTAGEEIDDLPKGSYTMTELYLFSYVAQNTPRTASAEPGVVDTGAAGRADAKYAKEHRAQESNFDWGPQRVCWLGQIVTDWMGDWGTLRKLSAKIRRPNLVGDINTVKGRVIDKTIEGDRHLVRLQIEVVNQAGTATATGEAVVELPTADQCKLPEWHGDAGQRVIAGGGY